MTEFTFIYDGEEVKTTGRVAQRNVYHTRDVNRVIGQMSILEIEPLGVAATLPGAKKWVDPRHLYYVILDDDINVQELKEENERFDTED